MNNITNNFVQEKPVQKNKKNIIIFFILLCALPVTIFLAQSIQNMLSKASSSQAFYTFVPLNGVMPPDQQVELMMNTDTNEIGFVRTAITFDPTKIQLSGEIIPSDVFQNVIKKTSMAEANSSGRIELVQLVNPDSPVPSGLFSIVKLPFTKVSNVQDDTASVTIDLSDVEIVDLSSNSLTPSSDPFVFTLNPTQSTISPTSPAQSGSVSMSVQAPTSVILQQNFSSSIVVNTNNNPLVGGDFVITYNPSYLTLNSVTTSVFSQKHDEVIDNSNGVYKVSLNVASGDLPVNGASLSPITLNFKSKGIGNASIGVSSATVVAGTGSAGQNLVVVPQSAVVAVLAPTSTPIPTNTSVPTPTRTPTPIPTNTSIPTPTRTPTPLPTLTPTPIPSPTTTITVYKQADINQDGAVNIGDYLLLLADYGKQNPVRARADINQDGIVNIKDYAIMYETFDF